MRSTRPGSSARPARAEGPRITCSRSPGSIGPTLSCASCSVAVILFPLDRPAVIVGPQRDDHVASLLVYAREQGIEIPALQRIIVEGEELLELVDDQQQPAAVRQLPERFVNVADQPRAAVEQPALDVLGFGDARHSLPRSGAQSVASADATL